MFALVSIETETEESSEEESDEEGSGEEVEITAPTKRVKEDVTPEGNDKKENTDVESESEDSSDDDDESDDEKVEEPRKEKSGKDKQQTVVEDRDKINRGEGEKGKGAR